MNKKYISILLALSIIITLFMPVSAELENITDMDLKDSTQTQNDDGLFDGTEIGFEEDEIIVDKKVYCNRTIEDDFDDKTVLLVFNKEKSIDKDVFTPEDFPEIDCISVEDLSAPTKELIDKQRNAMQRTNTSAAKLKEQSKNNDTWEKQKKTIPDELLDCDGGGLYLVNPENFRRILKITLREPGKENVLKAVKELEKRDDVIGADPNGYTKIMATTPNDNLFGYSQEVEADSIGLRDAWDKTTGSGSVTVAVIDSGIYMAHEDIQTRVSTTLGKNFADDCFCSLNPCVCHRSDPNGHGTHVAGIIGAIGNNTIGISGVCWNVNLVSYRVFGEFGKYEDAWLTAAINQAQADKIKIVNFSGGDPNDVTAVRTAVNNFTGLLVCAVGNDGWDVDGPPVSVPPYYNISPKTYPACYTNSNIITVAATAVNSNNIATAADWTGYINGIYRVGNGSNYGTTSVDIAAPGTKIMSTIPYNSLWRKELYSNFPTMQYMEMGGTSMAAPYVSGVAALILSLDPNATTTEIKNYILNGADTTVPAGYVAGNRRLNANGALSSFHIVKYNANGGSPTPANQVKISNKQLTLRPAPSIAPTYTIKYNSHGGTLVADKPVSRPFDVWKSTQGVNYAASGIYPAGTNVATTMTAQWSNPTYNGHLPSSSTMVRTGYSFKGWYTAQTGGIQITNATDITGNNITIHAQWTQTLSYIAGGGYVSPSSVVVNEGSNITLPTPIKSCTLTYNAGSGTVFPIYKPFAFTNTGWFTASSGGTKRGNAGAIYTPSGHETLYAQWGTQTLGNLPAPIYFPNTFVGWFNSSSGTIHYTLNSTITADMTICAQYNTPKPINKDTNYTTDISDVQGMEQMYKFVPPASKVYRIFSSNNNNYDPFVTLYDSAGNILAFNDDGGIGNNFSLTYYFKSGQTYYFGAKLYSTTALGTYTTRIEEETATTYTITYNANGGIGAPPADYKVINQNLTLTRSEPTRTDYTFLGWSTISGANNTATYYNTFPNLGNDLIYKNNASVTLYAVWRPRGDVNLNGSVNALDQTALNNHILGGTQLTGVSLIAADLNGDGKINALDLNILKQIILGP